MEKNIYYYCLKDNYGQNTGYVESIEMTEEEYEQYLEHYIENPQLDIPYLYKSYYDVLTASQS